ncbi:Unknown protein [Striga hermonthica]|uniref:Uncharacterized protein n=1 Tax=Striga hermonthica TaxID=68872 RepID=A0A9N7MP16_STRHE|nr:Unknown protein [Striga hermonthica]
MVPQIFPHRRTLVCYDNIDAMVSYEDKVMSGTSLWPLCQLRRGVTHLDLDLKGGGNVICLSVAASKRRHWPSWNSATGRRRHWQCPPPHTSEFPHRRTPVCYDNIDAMVSYEDKVMSGTSLWPLCQLWRGVTHLDLT